MHPIHYLLCFNYIIGVSGRPFFNNVLQKASVGHRSQKQTSGCRLFVIFMRKCTDMGAQMEGTKPPQNLSFSRLATFWVPWGAQGHQNGVQGCQNDPRDPKIEVLGSKTAPRMCAAKARWRGWAQPIGYISATVPLGTLGVTEPMFLHPGVSLVASSLSASTLLGVHTQSPACLGTPFFIKFRCFVCFCDLLRSRITTFCKKCPEVTPKGSQKEAKSHPNG